MNELARERIAAGVDLWLERVDRNDAAGAPGRWFMLRLDADVMSRLLRSRASCRADTLIEDVLFPPDYWRVGGATKSLRVRQHVWSCAEHRPTGSMLSGEIGFDQLVAALEAPHTSVGHKSGTSCFWYGGALVGAASNPVNALRSLQAGHPRLVARQIELDMAAVLSTHESCGTQAPSRRARVV